MKKNLAILAFLLSASSALCADWVEIGYKTYVDGSSITTTNNRYVYAWFKSLNPGDWQRIKNKQQHFIMDYFVFDCSSKKFDVIASTSYGIDGEVLSNIDISANYNPTYSYTMSSIIPDTIGETKYEATCRILH